MAEIELKYVKMVVEQLAAYQQKKNERILLLPIGGGGARAFEYYEPTLAELKVPYDRYDLPQAEVLKKVIYDKIENKITRFKSMINKETKKIFPCGLTGEDAKVKFHELYLQAKNNVHKSLTKHPEMQKEFDDYLSKSHDELVSDNVHALQLYRYLTSNLQIDFNGYSENHMDIIKTASEDIFYRPIVKSNPVTSGHERLQELAKNNKLWIIFDDDANSGVASMGGVAWALDKSDMLKPKEITLVIDRDYYGLANWTREQKYGRYVGMREALSNILPRKYNMNKERLYLLKNEFLYAAQPYLKPPKESHFVNILRWFRLLERDERDKLMTVNVPLIIYYHGIDFLPFLPDIRRFKTPIDVHEMVSVSDLKEGDVNGRFVVIVGRSDEFESVKNRMKELKQYVKSALFFDETNHAKAIDLGNGNK